MSNEKPAHRNEDLTQTKKKKDPKVRLKNSVKGVDVSREGEPWVWVGQ